MGLLLQGGVIFSTDGTAAPGSTGCCAITLATGHLVEIQFTAAATGQLGSLVVAIQSPGNVVENFDILAGNMGTPGALLDSLPISLTTSPSPTLFTGLSTLHPVLTAGTLYWISPEAPGNLQTGWDQAVPTTNLLLFFNDAPFLGPQPAPAFALLATPEPSTWTLLGIGLCGLLLVRRKLFSRAASN